MAGQFMRWDKFAKQHLDPPPSKRVGKRLVESGELEGTVLNGWPWVDMSAFRNRGNGYLGDEEGLDLLS